MSLDTKYRPITYDEVLGQEKTVQVLRNYVKSGGGYHQSYLFAGKWGSGKTTLGRILARALLCAAPVEGNACDACPSCRSLIDNGSSENFVEIDAATNSGKDSVRRILEEIQYTTFSGRQKIYLFDESHRLSTDALDALLKPMEDCSPGTEDKSLVCIFCTTEPEKMKATILSRCAPAFLIKPNTPSQIAGRLAYVCEKETLSFEISALELIAELTECHIRDALKAVEGVANLGTIDRDNVASYLHLDVHVQAMEILGLILSDLPRALNMTEQLIASTSPTTIYERLARMAMLTYRSSIGSAQVPSYLDAIRLKEIGDLVGARLLSYAARFASRPGRPSASMLLCDVAQLHMEATTPQMVFATAETQVAVPTPKATESGTVKAEDKPKLVDDVFVHPRAVKGPNDQPTPSAVPNASLKPLEFFRLVTMRAKELEREKSGRSGQDDVGSSGANQSG